MAPVPSFLEALSAADRGAFVGQLRRRPFDKRAVLFRQDDAGDDVALVIEGRVKVVACPAGGGDVLLAVRGPGDLVGELPVLDGQRRLASVVAVEAGELGLITAADMRRFLTDSPVVERVLLAQLALRLREADRSLIELSSRDALGRVAARLIRLADLYGVQSEDGLEIVLPITQSELAGWTGISRQTVARALAAMRRLRWVSTEHQRIVVHNPAALRAHR